MSRAATADPGPESVDASSESVDASTEAVDASGASARASSERSPTTDDVTDATVSVVLPTYERANVLGDAIESVLAQSHRNLELVVVDGGSTDGTADVVASFDDDRVRYHRREASAGVSAARNLGVRETTGEYVAFLDSDDRWRADKLHRQLDAIERSGSSCAVAYAGIEKADGEPRTRSGASGDVRAAVRRMAVPTYTSTLVVSRQAFEDVGGFEPRLPCFEDWELCLRLSATYEFAYVGEPLVTKGTAGDNISAEPDRLAEAYHVLRDRYHLPDETLARLLTDVGVTHCEAGRFRNGRWYLRQSLDHDRRQPTAVIALLAATPGSSTVFDAMMDRVYGLKRRLAN